MKFRWFVGALAAGFLFAVPLYAKSVVRGGVYIVHGTNFNGSPYSGTATIVITSDTTCRISWKTGDTTSTGICMRDADTFAAAYNMQGTVGLVIYKIMPDGVLDGAWTIAGQSGSGTETLTPK